MSFDFFVQTLCTHQVAFEAVSLNPTTKDIIRFQRPPANNRIDIFIDGVQVPPAGLDSYAELPFSRPEPYRITTGVNDLLFISTDFSPPRFVQMISGTSLRATDLAADLQKKIPELQISTSNNRVVFQSRTRTRGTAFAFHDPRWTDKTSSLPTTARVLAAYTQVGVVPGRFITGRRLFPAWSFEQDPSSTTGEKIVRFESPVPSHDPFVQANYITVAQDCRRCRGTRIEFDYVVEDGTYVEIRDTDLLLQEFDKYLFTRLGTHFKWPWIGSKLVDRIGGKGTTGVSTINALIAVDISSSFKTYQNIKLQQDSRFPQQQVSDAEYPLSLGGISVQTLPEDPTVAIVSTTIVSRSQVPVPLTRLVGNPSPFVLSGDPSAILRFRG